MDKTLFITREEKGWKGWHVIAMPLNDGKTWPVDGRLKGIYVKSFIVTRKHGAEILM